MCSVCAPIHSHSSPIRFVFAKITPSHIILLCFVAFKTFLALACGLRANPGTARVYSSQSISFWSSWSTCSNYMHETRPTPNRGKKRSPATMRRAARVYGTSYLVFFCFTSHLTIASECITVRAYPTTRSHWGKLKFGQPKSLRRAPRHRAIPAASVFKNHK